jgi:hypothetical protein
MDVNSFKMISPEMGSSVPLLFNQRSGRVKFDIEDPRLAFTSGDFLKEDSKTARDAYKSALKGRPGGATTPGGGQSDGGAAPRKRSRSSNDWQSFNIFATAASSHPRSRRRNDSASSTRYSRRGPTPAGDPVVALRWHGTRSSRMVW